MGWSTVEWPPKHGNIKVKSKAKRKKNKKLFIICLTIIMLFCLTLGAGLFYQNNNWLVNSTQNKIKVVHNQLKGYYESFLNSSSLSEKKKTAEAEEKEVTEKTSNKLAKQPSVSAPPEPARTRGIVPRNQQEVNRGIGDMRYIKKFKMTATAYTHTGNPTASGSWPEVGVAAVDPSVIPMGTRLYIEGYGAATALDKGGAIVGNKIDLFMDTEQQAIKWGVRQVEVYILK